MKKKLIAIVASLAMVVSLVPATAFAEEPAPDVVTISGTATHKESTLKTQYEGLKESAGIEDNVTKVVYADGLLLSGSVPYTELSEFSGVKDLTKGHYVDFNLSITGANEAKAFIRVKGQHALKDGTVLDTTDDLDYDSSDTGCIVRLDKGNVEFSVDWAASSVAPGRWTDKYSSIPTAEQSGYKEIPADGITPLSRSAKTFTVDTQDLKLLSEADTEALNTWIAKVNATNDLSGLTLERKVKYARETYDALSDELKDIISQTIKQNAPKNYKKVYEDMLNAEAKVKTEVTKNEVADKIDRLKALPKTEFKDQAEIEGYFLPLDEVNKLVAGLDKSVKSELTAELDFLNDYNGSYKALIKKYVDPKYAAAEKIDLTKEVLEDSELALIQELKFYVEGEYIETADIKNFKKATYDALIAALDKVEKDAKSLANAEVTVAGADSIVYDGTKKTPELTVTISGKEVPAEAYDTIYSDNKDAGEAIVTIIPKDESGYIGKKEATFTIKAAALTDAMVKSVANATYTGKAVTPAVTVEKGVTYDVAYSNNTAVGKATATITGTGNYTGTITKNFIVKPATEAISSLKAGKKSLTVAYKAQTGAKYRIVYSPAKGQAKAVNTTATKKTIKSLKAGKTYKVKVRAYKVIDGTTYNGYYSTVKKVKVK